jgi:hypothetical protein
MNRIVYFAVAVKYMKETKEKSLELIEEIWE